MTTFKKKEKEKKKQKKARWPVKGTLGAVVILILGSSRSGRGQAKVAPLASCPAKKLEALVYRYRRQK